jgi:hypothetical protein
VDVSVPGTFLNAPLRYQDTATHEAWIQMQLNLEWLMNGSGVGPTFLIGGAGNVLVDYMDSLTGRNAAGTFTLTAPRFDPYTGVMGADFSTSEQPQSIMARFSGGRVTLVRNLNSILSDTSTFHSLEVFDRKTTYEFPEPPKASDLVAGSVYTYLPSDATLYVNGVSLPNTRNTTLRALRWPTKKPTSGIYKYVFKAVFRTGMTIEHRITMPVAEAEKKPILINFYELQKK